MSSRLTNRDRRRLSNLTGKDLEEEKLRAEIYSYRKKFYQKTEFYSLFIPLILVVGGYFLNKDDIHSALDDRRESIAKDNKILRLEKLKLEMQRARATDSFKKENKSLYAKKKKIEHENEQKKLELIVEYENKEIELKSNNDRHRIALERSYAQRARNLKSDIDTLLDSIKAMEGSIVRLKDLAGSKAVQPVLLEILDAEKYSDADALAALLEKMIFGGDLTTVSMEVAKNRFSALFDLIDSVGNARSKIRLCGVLNQISPFEFNFLNLSGIDIIDTTLFLNDTRHYFRNDTVHFSIIESFVDSRRLDAKPINLEKKQDQFIFSGCDSCCVGFINPENIAFLHKSYFDELEVLISKDSFHFQELALINSYLNELVSISPAAFFSFYHSHREVCRHVIEEYRYYEILRLVLGKNDEYIGMEMSLVKHLSKLDSNAGKILISDINFYEILYTPLTEFHELKASPFIGYDEYVENNINAINFWSDQNYRELLTDPEKRKSYIGPSSLIPTSYTDD